MHSGIAGYINIRVMKEPAIREVTVKIVPYDVKTGDFEDLLATDDLFTEYFNEFLQLPSFPEPLFFNKETGGFEVLTDDRRKLANEIKAVVRAGRRRKKIYRATRNHSFSNIPLIPMEEPPFEEEKEIDTSFTVQTLNKEQGIEWIKAHRLPAFLESDCYIEYRLAKLISQSQVSSRPEEYISMQIDYTPPVRKTKKVVEEEEPKVDIKEVIMKDLFVSMGNAPTSDTDAYVSQAQIALDTCTTPSVQSHPTPSIISLARAQSPGRIGSAASSTQGRDSGLGTSRAGSSMDTDVSQSEDSTWGDSRLFDNISKPVTPRPSQAVCAVADRYNGGSVAFVQPIPLPQPEAGSSEDEETDPTQTPVFADTDEFGAVIVGTVMKHAVAEITGKEVDEISKHPDIQQIYPDSKFNDVTKDSLQQMISKENDQVDQSSKTTTNNNHLAQTEQVAQVKFEADEEEESDNDPLLNSDEDYEGDRDVFFRKKTNKPHQLTKRKGLDQFKAFLCCTMGERYWHLWLDIEHAKLIKDTDKLANFLSVMREKYQRHGAVYELSTETKVELGLTEPTQWTIEKIKSIQNKIAEPLVLYWAPRFLINQRIKANPTKHVLYHHQQLLKEKTNTHPTPPTIALLPLRPKSCVPRFKLPKQSNLEISDAFESLQSSSVLNSSHATTPPVGFRRVHGISEMIKDHKDKNNKETKQKWTQKTPRELITPRINKHGRPPSAPIRSTTRLSVQDTSRPASAEPRSERKDSVASSNISEFIGGRRMEGLLQALVSERKSGSFFRKHIDLSDNMLWKNALTFWLEVQDYHQIFYSEVLDPYSLEKKAKHIYSQYIVVGSPCSINSSLDIREQIQQKVNPPYEDLFDLAEESVLSVLFEAWCQAIAADNSTFDKIELIDVKRHLEAKSKYVISLQRRGIIKERAESPDDPMEGYQDPVYDDTLLEKIPEEFLEFTLEKLVHNRIELEYFRQFLADNYASMDLMCWMDIEAFRRIPHTEEKRRDLKAKDCKLKYFNKKYFFGPNSPAGRDGQEKVMQAGGGWGKLLNDRPPTASLLEAQKYVQERLERKWLPIFLATEKFAERQRPNSGMDDVVEDVMIQRKKKNAAIWKMLESKWVSSSKDILTFRRALMNPVTSLQFRRFVSIKGDSYENDVLFWQEVQRYKDLCHLHSDRSLIQQKTTAVINCFIDSPIPPSLQIDITQEMADKILERKLETSPYLFREAQLTVFRVMFQQWTDFCHYRSNLSEDKILPTIERHRRKSRIEEKKKQKEQERKDAKETARRRALGLPIAEGQEDDFDPFEKAGRVGSDDDASDDGTKGAISWSYGHYVKGLEKEEVLNSVDESTFASLTSRPASAATHVTNEQRGSDDSDDSSVASNDSKKEDSKKKERKTSKAKVETSESASQTDVKPKKSVKVAEKVKRPSTDAEIKSEVSRGIKKHMAKKTMPEPEQKVQKPKMARGMPPLVRKN